MPLKRAEPERRRGVPLGAERLFGGDSRRLPLQAGLAVLVAAGLLVLLSREVAPAEIERALDHTTPLLLSTAALGASGFILMRAWRYLILLSGDGGEGLPAASAPQLVGVTAAAWGFGLLLPFAAADLGFLWLSTTRLQVPVERAAAAAVLARLLDLSSLCVIALLAAPLARAALPAPLRLLTLGAAVVLVAATAALLVAPSRRVVLRVLAGVPSLRRRVVRVDDLLRTLGKPRQLSELVLSTLGARVCTALMYLALFAAAGEALSFWQAWFALSVRTLLLGFPVQGLGGLGTSQAWWTLALVLLGQPLSRALPVGVTVHLLDLGVSLPLAALGSLLLLWRPAVLAQRA